MLTLLRLSAAFLLSLNVSFLESWHWTSLTQKSASVAAALTGDHQGHSVSLIVVTHDNLTVVSAWVVGTETGDLHGSIEGIGRVSWQHDASTESLIHLDYITFGREKIGFFNDKCLLASCRFYRSEHNLYGSPDKWMEVNMYHHFFICWDDLPKSWKSFLLRELILFHLQGCLLRAWPLYCSGSPHSFKFMIFFFRFCAKNIVWLLFTLHISIKSYRSCVFGCPTSGGQIFTLF